MYMLTQDYKVRSRSETSDDDDDDDIDENVISDLF
jgi:hypothetical protein